MSRTRTGAALALLALALLALPGGSSGDASSPTWAGTWDTDFGEMTLGAGGSGSYVSPYGPNSSGTVDGNVEQLQPVDLLVRALDAGARLRGG